MSDLNKVMLIGNITKDPEIRTIPSGQQVASFSIATNRTWKDKDGGKKEQAEFHSIVAWGKLAEIIGQYCKKGMKIYIEGRLATKAWDDQNGVKKFKTEIIAENLLMLSSRQGQSSSSYPQQKVNEDEEMPIIQADDEEIAIEDIPF